MNNVEELNRNEELNEELNEEPKKRPSRRRSRIKRRQLPSNKKSKKKVKKIVSKPVNFENCSEYLLEDIIKRNENIISVIEKIFFIFPPKKININFNI